MEVLLRASPEALGVVGNSVLLPDHKLNHIFHPSSSIIRRDWPQIQPYEQRYNKDSWVSDEELLSKDKDSRFRIAFVGDSFTEGVCAPAASMPSVVRSLISKEEKFPYKNFQIINTGTVSYAPLIYAVLLREKILPRKPDLIVLSIDMTDVFDDYLYSQAAVRDSSGIPIAVPAGAPFLDSHFRLLDGIRERGFAERMLVTLSKFSKLALLGRQFFEASLNRPENVDPKYPKLFDWMHEPWSPVTESLVHQSMDTLKLLVSMCKESHIPLYVTSVPHLEQVRGELSLRPHKSIRETVEGAGGIYIDSLTPFRARAHPPEQFYIADDMHLNEKGNQLWGEILTREIVAKLESKAP